MVRPCSCPASDESGKGLQRQRCRFGLSNLLKKKSRRSDRDFEVFVSVRRKKRRQDSELKLQVGVFGYRRGVCLDLLHQSHTTQPTDCLCEKLVSRTNLAGTQTH